MAPNTQRTFQIIPVTITLFSPYKYIEAICNLILVGFSDVWRNSTSLGVLQAGFLTQSTHDIVPDTKAFFNPHMQALNIYV